MSKPLASIIILTYNRVHDLSALLENLKRQSLKDYEIIVVDNNSTDNTQEEIPLKFPSIRYIKIHLNLGVPGGRNLGIVNARGDYLVFIDNDTEVEPDFLEKVIKTFEKEPRAGILTFKILNYFTGEIDLTTWVIDQELKVNEEFRPVQSFVGCGHAFRREVVDQVGLLWDRFFFMHEETEYSLRLLHTDYHVYYVPDIRVYHKVSAENRYQFSERFYYYGIRNEFWNCIRNVPWKEAISFLGYMIAAALPYSIKRNHFFRYCRGIYEGIFHSREALKLRNPISKSKYQEYLSLYGKKRDRFSARIKRFYAHKS